MDKTTVNAIQAEVQSADAAEAKMRLPAEGHIVLEFPMDIQQMGHRKLAIQIPADDLEHNLLTDEVWDRIVMVFGVRKARSIVEEMRIDMFKRCLFEQITIQK